MSDDEPTADDYESAARIWEAGQHAVSQTDTPDGNGEAARYRRRLRDTEAERDQLRQRVETMQRAEIQRMVADRLADPADLWRDGSQLADVLDDSGDVDAEKVDGLVGGLLESHKHWAVTPPATAPPRHSSPVSGASAQEPPRQSSWAKAIRGE